ncbi:ABC transporter permease, partial [Pseudomonas sp. 5P_5.1_Bac1]|nr:ABC transporter permease [Pseudomonas sp. 5P_5.1_Bac1]
MSAIALDTAPPVVARKDRAALWRAYGLLAPLVVFLLLTFVGPIGTLLWRAVADNELPQALPATAQAVADWDGTSAP